MFRWFFLYFVLDITYEKHIQSKFKTRNAKQLLQTKFTKGYTILIVKTRDKGATLAPVELIMKIIDRYYTLKGWY